MFENCASILACVKASSFSCWSFCRMFKVSCRVLSRSSSRRICAWDTFRWRPPNICQTENIIDFLPLWKNKVWVNALNARENILKITIGIYSIYLFIYIWSLSLLSYKMSYMYVNISYKELYIQGPHIFLMSLYSKSPKLWKAAEHESSWNIKFSVVLVM